jgi:hypothetical protein
VSQHSQRTQDGPTTLSIVTGALMVAGSMAGTLYVIGGPGITGRELVSSLMGAALIGFTVAFTMNRMVERAVVRDRAERAAERAERERRERDRIEAELEAIRARAEHDAPEPDRYVDRAPLAPPMHPEPERYEPEPEPVDAYGRTRDQAWQDYYANHPEVRASWAQQNGRWPNCPGPECDPGRDRQGWTYDEQRQGWVTSPEMVATGAGQPPETWVEPDEPLGYQADPERPWRAFDPGDTRVSVPLPPRDVPVSPGRDWPEDRTEVIRRPELDETQVIQPQS